jgi:hypothetical protein
MKKETPKENPTMKILTCHFNIDTANVELLLLDGTLISIDCTAVENQVAYLKTVTS